MENTTLLLEKKGIGNPKCAYACTRMCMHTQTMCTHTYGMRTHLEFQKL